MKAKAGNRRKYGLHFGTMMPPGFETAEVEKTKQVNSSIAIVKQVKSLIDKLEHSFKTKDLIRVKKYAMQAVSLLKGIEVWSLVSNEPHQFHQNDQITDLIILAMDLSRFHEIFDDLNTSRALYEWALFLCQLFGNLNPVKFEEFSFDLNFKLGKVRRL
jgi:hypothetical protein